MHQQPISRNGGQILVQQLRIHGVKRIFMVAGESYLPCIDAFYDHRDQIEIITCRHESGAGFMAEAYGKLTGEPGICFVTRGPGATNASIAIHTAYQDSTPLIVFVGQVGNDFMEREAFQEIDYRRMFGTLTKWVAQIDRTDRIPEFLRRAFTIATSGRPGPVVLALPEDTLWGSAYIPDLPRYQKASIIPHSSNIQPILDKIYTAKNPIAIVGGSGWNPSALKDLECFAERLHLPISLAWRRLECFDHHHSHFVGHVGWGMDTKLRQAIQESDCVIALGTRLGEATTEGYSLLKAPLAEQPLIHIYPQIEELNKVYVSEHSLCAHAPSFVREALQLLPAEHPPADPHWVKILRKNYLATLEALPAPGNLSLDAIAVEVAEKIPKDACITVGAGNYALYPHRYRMYGGWHTSIVSTVGAMGYGLPAAISVKLEHPEQMVLCYAGDGCFQMNCNELGVAMEHRLGIIILVFNNGILGTIQAHHDRDFPGRGSIGLQFQNPDFVQLIQAYGGFGKVVAKTEEFSAAFEAAQQFTQQHSLPALLEIRYDPRGIAPGQQLTQGSLLSIGEA